MTPPFFLRPDWNLSVLDLSYNKLSIKIAENISILSHIPKLRVLNLSGNDLTNLGNLCLETPRVGDVANNSGHGLFSHLELLVAEDNLLTFKVFSELKNLFPNIKVVVLNKNRISHIPNLLDYDVSVLREFLDRPRNFGLDCLCFWMEDFWVPDFWLADFWLPDFRVPDFRVPDF